MDHSLSILVVTWQSLQWIYSSYFRVLNNFEWAALTLPSTLSNLRTRCRLARTPEGCVFRNTWSRSRLPRTSNHRKIYARAHPASLSSWVLQSAKQRIDLKSECQRITDNRKGGTSGVGGRHTSTKLMQPTIWRDKIRLQLLLSCGSCCTSKFVQQ